MKSMKSIVVAAAVGAAALAFSALSASAAIVCNGDTCWHAHTAYHYPPDAGVVVHPDNWHWGSGEHFSFREHQGRGYWNGDHWTTW